MRGIVAFVTAQAGVLAFERVSRLLVIEGFDVPLDQRKVLAIVLGVAACAFLAGTGGNVVAGVQSLMGEKPRRDLTVTVQTFKGGCPAKLVATGAIRGAV